jgi:DnaJ-class molecular chaperone
MDWKTFDFKTRKAGRKGGILNKSIYRCGFCNGKGFMPSKKNMKCLACLGTGTIKVQPPAVICAYCNGSGKSHLNTDLTCIVCHGRGVLSVHTKKLEICPSCKGKGREKGGNLPCSMCKGKGVIAKQEVFISIARGKNTAR